MQPESDRELDALRHPRRVFLGRLAGKAAYVAPAILALQCARPLHAGGASCGDAGSPCLTDADCCGGFTCQAPPPTPMACMGEMSCTCE